jgi:hypothetical protein
MATVGTTRGALHVSGGVRLFALGGKTIASPMARATFSSLLFNVSAFGQGRSLDSTATADVTAQVTPIQFIALIGGAGRTW